MEKLKKFFILILFFIFFSQIVFAQNKIAYIDLDLILSQSIPSKNLFEQLKIKEEKELNELKKKEKMIKEKKNKILNTKNILAKDEYNQKVITFQNQVKDYQDLKKTIIQSLKKKRNDEVLRFLQLVNPLIEDVMNKKSIEILIEKKNVFIAKSNYDITAEIINNINKNIKEFKIKD